MFRVTSAISYSPAPSLSTAATPSTITSTREHIESSAASDGSQSTASTPPSRRSPHPLQTKWRQEHGQSVRTKLQGTELQLNLHKQSTAPIKELLNQEEILAAIEQLSESLQAWGPVTVPPQPCAEDEDSLDWRQPRRTQQERWNKRLEATRDMLKSIEAEVKAGDYNFAFAYCVDQKCIGLMTLENQLGPIYVEGIVTHPGSQAVGGSLIESAVGLSKKEGRAGRLHLVAADDDAFECYKKLGFVPDGKDGNAFMSLDPAKSNKWCTDAEGQWRLVKLCDEHNMPKNYIA